MVVFLLKDAKLHSMIIIEGENESWSWPGMGSITFESNILQLQLLCIGPITITITITFENHHHYYNYNYFSNVIYYNYLLLFQLRVNVTLCQIVITYLLFSLSMFYNNCFILLNVCTV